MTAMSHADEVGSPMAQHRQLHAKLTEHLVNQAPSNFNNSGDGSIADLAPSNENKKSYRARTASRDLLV